MRNHPKTLKHPLSKRQLTALVIFVVIGGLGVYLLTASHALSPYVSSEAEGGSLNGAVTTTSAAASGGSYVKYGSGTGGGGGGSGTALTSRPNDGSSYWPDFSNTGYNHTPANADGTGVAAYPGKLTDYASGMSATTGLNATFPDNSVVSYKHFLGKTLIYGKNLTFVGCLFEGNFPNDNLVQVYSTGTVKFLYTTFKPSALQTPPGNNGTVSSSHTAPGTPYRQSWQYISSMVDGQTITMDHDDLWGNAGAELDLNGATWTNNYIHDESDTDNSGGGNYHHDGIGPQSEGNGGPMTISHNTIASLGNTNGLALQGSGVYSGVVFTNNYVSGWGYALSVGVSNNSKNNTFTGNIFSAELSVMFGPLYPDSTMNTAHGTTWRNNMYQARSGDGWSARTPADNGKYWWPTDDSTHATDFSN